MEKYKSGTFNGEIEIKYTKSHGLLNFLRKKIIYKRMVVKIYFEAPIIKTTFTNRELYSIYRKLPKSKKSKLSQLSSRQIIIALMMFHYVGNYHQLEIYGNRCCCDYGYIRYYIPRSY